MILLTAMLIGLLLAADDLVLRTPGFVAVAVANVREHAPQMGQSMHRLKGFKFNFPALPQLPSLPNFRTKDGIAKPLTAAASEDDEDELKAPVRLEIPNPYAASR